MDEENLQKEIKRRNDADRAREAKEKLGKELAESGHVPHIVLALVEMVYLLDKPKGRIIKEDYSEKMNNPYSTFYIIRLENGMLLNKVAPIEFAVIESEYWLCDGVGCKGEKFFREMPHREFY